MLTAQENNFLGEYLGVVTLELIHLESFRNAMCTVYVQVQKTEILDLLSSKIVHADDLILDTKDVLSRIRQCWQDDQLWFVYLDVVHKRLIDESEHRLRSYKMMSANLRSALDEEKEKLFSDRFWKPFDGIIKRGAVVTGMGMVLIVGLIILAFIVFR